MKLSNHKCLHCGSNPARMKRIVDRLVKAEVAASWKGSQPPDDQVDIDRELNSAREAFRIELHWISA